MYLFYNSEGTFEWCVGDSPIDNLTVPEGYIALYLDDVNEKDIIKNYSNYKMKDGVIVYDPIPESIRLSFEQQSKIEELNIACNLDILDGFYSSVLGGEKHKYKFNLEWQNNFNRQMNSLILDSTVNEVIWNTIDIGTIKLTREQFINLYQDSKKFIDDKMNRYYSLKETIINCKNTD